MVSALYRLAPLVVVSATACGLELNFDGTHYQCGPAGECPDGFACGGDGFCMVTSGNTSSSARLRMVLEWTSNFVDLDLHLVSADHTSMVCDNTWDCFSRNATPVWNASNGRANPKWAGVASDGLGGPEEIDIDAPEDGLYSALVHYRGGSGPASGQVKVFDNGTQVNEFSFPTLSTGAMFGVFYLTWTGGEYSLSGSSASCSVSTSQCDAGTTSCSP